MFRPERHCVDCGKGSRAWVGALETDDGPVCGDCAVERCNRVAALQGALNEVAGICGKKIHRYKGTQAGDAGTALAREIQKVLRKVKKRG